jgi:hypothetical protein
MSSVRFALDCYADALQADLCGYGIIFGLFLCSTLAGSSYAVIVQSLALAV